ncbi:MAG TPA: S9 family peptidase [Pyrinomonadaceae bacterium]|jgi:dipeptidyl aminopeptidase/acylaminoacyl peptidase
MHQYVKFLVLGVIFFAVFLTIPNNNAEAQMPPLIDREIFFDNPEIAGAQISPDGKFIAFRKPLKGTMNIWVKRADEPFDKARPLTNRTDRPISNYFWSEDGKYILFVQDKGGDENFNVYAVNPAESPASGSEVPAARNLTEAKNVRAFIYGVPETDPDVIYVGINERDKAWHDVYKVKISTGERTLVMENKDRLQGVIFDNADKMRLAMRVPQSGDTEILLLDGEKPRVIYTCSVFESCSPVRFHKDNKRVYLTTNKGNPDLAQLVLLDVATGKEELVETDPMKRVDFGGAAFSDVTDEIVATTYNDERVRYYFKNKDFEDAYKFIQGKLPNRDINFVSSTKDENLWLVAANSDVEPGEVYLFDRRNKKLTLQYKAREKLPREALSPMKAVRYKSSDGMEIPAFLTLPKGVAAKNLPAVIVPHGGPWARDFWGYNSQAQFLANRGYAVLQPNFRASTGYGKKFLNAGNNEWGQKMQDDLTYGVRYLVEQGIADPKRVGIMGGSYGGYAALAGVTFTPDLFAAAVAIVAPSNLRTLLETIPPYWEAGRTIFYKRMGDPNTPEGKAQIERQSPLSHVAKIKTPLLVVQGANDPRVNKRESDQIVIALRERGFPVEYMVAPDEGHGFARPVNNMAMIAKTEKFLAKYLGGRFQESMTPEVAKRLEEITVDPKTVTLAQKVEMNSAPAANVSGKWNLMANAGGQELPITMDLTQTGGDFSGSLNSAMGGGKIEKGKVSGKNIVGTARVEVQGQSMELKIEGVIDGNKITGTLAGPGLPPISFTGEKSN